MQFFYHIDSAKKEIILQGDDYRYLFKVRRHKIGEEIYLRNLIDDFLYLYKIEDVYKNYAKLIFLKKELKKVSPNKYLHIGWCIIDPKIIEKSLAIINEIGVSKITFIYCDRSQRNFKINLDRLKKILINSSQQCGRSSLMEFEILNSIEEYFQAYPDSVVLDFGEEEIQKDSFDRVLVGCEGGFSNREKELLLNKKIFAFDTPLVLKSQSAVIAIASKCML